MYGSVMWISYKNKKFKKNLKHEHFWVKSCIFERKVDKIDCKSHILNNFKHHNTIIIITFE